MVQSNKGVFSVFKQEVSSNRQAPFYCRWTEEEDKLLFEAVNSHGPHKWSLIARNIPNRTPVQCSTRWLGALNPHVHKGRWSKEEDEVLTDSVRPYLKGKITLTEDNLPWSKIAQHIANRTGIQCQARWTEALDPAVRKGRWKKEEDEMLKKGVEKFGCCWIRVAGSIPGRTQRQCRTRWNQIQSKNQKELKTETKLAKPKKRKRSDADVVQWKSTTSRSNNILSATPIQLAVPDQKPYIMLSRSVNNAIVIPFDIVSPPSSPSVKEEEFFCMSPTSTCSVDTFNSIQQDQPSPTLTALDAVNILDDFDYSFSSFVNEKEISLNEAIPSASFSTEFLNQFDFNSSLLDSLYNTNNFSLENLLSLNSNFF
ncbi:hypothetical protein MFLAVUS_008981 [Mucor flavus]|uniref:Uncharacterized protein n=1 Tax=Mucor flavus TaxID=439312 RepID=A0ABP9Z8Q5_9FUNG